MGEPFISIIMPAYNAEKHIAEAIGSVLDQDYPHFELLVINDGSTDATATLVQSFEDQRIRYFEQANAGVSAARNIGLAEMEGDFFCFLDADDLMTPQALTARLDMMQHLPDVMFVGGGQEQRDESLEAQICLQLPSYQGNPRAGLVALDGNCFINCGTWLLRRQEGINYQFPVGWTHSEDLAFFISIAAQGRLVSIPEVVQIYRRHDSAMSNLRGLQQGYWQLYRFIEGGGHFENKNERQYFRSRVRRIMFLSYLRQAMWRAAIQVLFRRFD